LHNGSLLSRVEANNDLKASPLVGPLFDYLAKYSASDGTKHTGNGRPPALTHPRPCNPADHATGDHTRSGTVPLNRHPTNTLHYSGTNLLLNLCFPRAIDIG
jgi:hypothetical protein